MTETDDGFLWIAARIGLFISAVLSCVSFMTGVFILYGGITKNEMSARLAALIPSGEPFTSAAVLIAAAVAGGFALWCLLKGVMSAVPLVDSLKDIAVSLFFYRMLNNMKPLLFLAAAGGVYFIIALVITVKKAVKKGVGNIA